MKNLETPGITGRVGRYGITRGWFFFDDYVLISLKLIACRICVFLSGLLGIKICLSHGQIGLL